MKAPVRAGPSHLGSRRLVLPKFNLKFVERDIRLTWCCEPYAPLLSEGLKDGRLCCFSYAKHAHRHQILRLIHRTILFDSEQVSIKSIFII